MSTPLPATPPLDTDPRQPTKASNIPRRESQSPSPLSFAQQHIWLLDQLKKGVHYNEPLHLQLCGHLNVAVLKASVDAIVQRHEILRTTFTVEHGEPVQYIAPRLTIPMPLVDLTDLPEPKREAAMRRAVADETSRPFDLQRGPLMRAMLLRLNQLNHVLAFTFHHIIWDDLSCGIFHRELAALYEAATTKSPQTPLPDLPIQYADFALWQRQSLKTGAFESQLSYWKTQLKGAPSLPELPTDRPRPATLSYRGKTQIMRLEPAQIEELKSMGQREGCTLFMILLTAFQTVLAQYTNSTDVVVGSAVNNRHRAEIEGLLGCFVNTLALRTDFSGNPSFLQQLSRVRKTALNAFSNAAIPFENVVEQLCRDRSVNHRPFFQVLFNYYSPMTPTTFLSNLTIRRLIIDPGISKSDLTMMVEKDDQGPYVRAEFSTDLFTPSTITRLLGHYQTLLNGILTNPNTPINRLPLLTAAEQQLSLEWNYTTRDHPPEPDRVATGSSFKKRTSTRGGNSVNEQPPFNILSHAPHMAACVPEFWKSLNSGDNKPSIHLHQPITVTVHPPGHVHELLKGVELLDAAVVEHLTCALANQTAHIAGLAERIHPALETPPQAAPPCVS